MPALIALAVAALVVLAERRRLRGQAPPRRPRRRHTAEVLYTRAGEPQWGAVGAWDGERRPRLSRRRMKTRG